jgi:type IV pilus modification protein PilV
VSVRCRLNGFSLIEVLCAILILGIGMVGLTQGLTTALGSSKESELQTGAALIAANRIELLRADGYLVNGREEGEADQGATRFLWEESVTSTDLDGLHEITVTIRTRTSETPVYELRTLLFDPPLASESSRSSPGTDKKTERDRERRRR